MNIDLTRLRGGIDKFINVDILYSFDEDKLLSDIKSMDNFRIVGQIRINNIGEYILDVNVKGTAILKCAVTLDDIPFDIDMDICDNLVDLYDESGISEKNIGNSIDILPIIWENILMEIPTHIVSEGASSKVIEGDGWSLNKENVAGSNSELSKLKDLYKGEEV